MKLFRLWPRFVAVAFPPRHSVIAVKTALFPLPLWPIIKLMRGPSATSRWVWHMKFSQITDSSMPFSAALFAFFESCDEFPGVSSSEEFSKPSLMESSEVSWAWWHQPFIFKLRIQETNHITTQSRACLWAVTIVIIKTVILRWSSLPLLWYHVGNEIASFHVDERVTDRATRRRA